MIPIEKAISPKVVMRYPMIGRRKGYRKRENKTQMTFCHPPPFQRSLIFRFHFFLRLVVTKRITANVPRITADQKGKKPGPGE
jgi:hypothetical protein